MAASEVEIMQRGDATGSVMEALQDKWVWDEMSIADFKAFLQSVRDAGTQENAKKAAYDGQRGHTEVLFTDLERRKVQGLGMATYRFRGDTEKLALVQGVGEYGDGRENTLKEAEEWAAAWKLIEPTWSPTTQNTVAAFETLMGDCSGQKKLLTDAKTAWRKASTHHNALLAELEDLCVAWYGQATRVFSPDSEEGILLRGQIPTFDGGGNSGSSTTTSPASSPTTNP